MTTQSKGGFASRCKACDSIIYTFQHTKPLPDGSFDDLCSNCKSSTYDSDGIKYRDFTHEHIDSEGEFEGFKMEVL